MPAPSPLASRGEVREHDVDELDDVEPIAPNASSRQMLGARLAAATIILVVVGILGAVAAVAVAAVHSASDTHSSTDIVVFTAVAPYRPGAPAKATQVVAVPAPQGNWTATRGVQIAERAVKWVSWPYSFGAGDAAGPTYGFAVDADSRNDANVRGFDCSGLVINAIAPWLRVDHSASAQYEQTGSIHPALDQLQPGDLIFWSTDGTIRAIHHVAIYLGNGKVVQAPRSGAFVEVIPLDQVGGGRIGVTRPLT